MHPEMSVGACQNHHCRNQSHHNCEGCITCYIRRTGNQSENIINQNKELISNRRVLDGLPQSDYWKKHHLDITIEKFGNSEPENYKYL